MPVDKKALREAKAQLTEDYERSMTEFMLDKSPEARKVFCLGVTMALLTLKGIAEEPEHRFSGCDLEQSVEAYYTAAQTSLHAD